MTTRPRLRIGRHLLPGVVAVALFLVLAAAFLATPLGAQAGFPGTTINETNVTAAVAGGGTLADGSGTYEATVNGGATVVTVTLDDGTTFQDRITAAQVEGEREGTVTSAVVTAEDNGTEVTVARLPLVDHANASAGPGAQVAGVNRSADATSAGDGIYAVARRGSITENVGYTMFDLRTIQPLPGEGFLLAFEMIDIVLVAALVAAVMLARREPGEQPRTALGAEDGDDEGGDA